jgi:glutamyl-tRNA synthetase
MSLSLSTKLSPFPYAVSALASYAGDITTSYDDSLQQPKLEYNGASISSEEDIVNTLSKAASLSPSPNNAQNLEPIYAIARSLPTITAFPDLVKALDTLDDHLAYRTYVADHELSSADFYLWGALKGAIKILGLLKNNNHPHLLRWFNHIEALDATQAALASLVGAKSTKARSNKTAASFALGLQDAKEGQVVTRFPPEPSGYLHIGHAKAATLNHYFAKMYKGKLIIRFDDTNPTKERTEFEETILEDLRLLGITGDQVTHTSDYFDTLYDLALKVIKAGKAYTDNTIQEEMRHQRMHGIASAHRDDSIEDNLKHFEEMKSGSEEGTKWCLRAKMSVDDPNKALRDPVIYRCNLMPHHRTGDQWKIYPTYDFACPVVDSLEGVTHALRTNEYRDRNPQYHWMIEALGIRKVNIWDFSRLNFIYTLLSKRKLHWFVDKGLVKGWDDPRFPTVRGIRRRGLTVEAIQQFMLAQGPSQAIVSLEWDSIWALNKKIIDPIAPRHWAIVKKGLVPVALSGGPTRPEVKNVPRHKKDPAIGEKQTVYSANILVEQDDAVSFEDQEEITLMDWGNAIVKSKTVSPDGEVTEIHMELHLEGDFRKTKKKITWLSQPYSEGTTKHDLVSVTLLDYDYLITKKKLEEGDELSDFVTPNTEFKEEAWADANVVTQLKKGDIMQFERKGYYIVDQDQADDMQFVKIPDGKASSLASKSATAAAAAAAAPSAAAPITTSGIELPTGMYKVEPILDSKLKPDTSTLNMYKVDSIHVGRG